MRTLFLTGNLTLWLVVCLTVCSCAPREYAKEKIACHVVDWRGGSDVAVIPVDIHVMNGDGTGRTPIGEGVYPDWAPDGRRLVVVGPSYDSLHVLDTESGEARMLLDLPHGGIQEPSWSPDGRTIAFAVRSGAIWTIDADGSNLQQLITDYWPSVRLGPPSWSPDGAQITFSMHGDCRDEEPCSEVYVMGSDGSGVTRLTDGGGSYWDPVWSPKGDRIAFLRYSDGEDSVYVINADGSGQRYVARGRLYDWSPDGTRIYYHAWSSTVLWTVDADDANRRQQLFDLNCEAPAWAPVVEP